jgi:hypothetical protein
MARWSSSVVLALSAWLIMSSLSGCNGVLGIEEARPEATSATSAVSSLGYYTGGDSCRNDNTDCQKCVAANCSQYDPSVCLADAECRAQLDGYASCLGSNCTNDPATCFEPLIGFTKAPILSCILDNCSAKCGAAPIYSACQLYCACMGADCAGKFADTAGTTGDCMTQCNALESSSPELVNCRRSHCEIAKAYPPPAPHCDHATGVTFCSAPSADTDRASQCRDLSLDTFACKADSDCCSGNCGPQMACAPK